MPIQSVCVCGAGTMGRGIAQSAAQAGLTAILYELNTGVLEQARSSIQANLKMLVDKGKLTAEDANNITARIKFTGELQDCVADLCLEAIIENAEAKQKLFSDLFEINGATTLFATNTSSLSVTLIASGLPDPTRVAGMHFFNPATIMKLVEIVSTARSSQETIRSLVELAKKMGKTPVVCNDAPGFIVNRVARPFYIESLRLAEEGYASYEVIDSLLESAGFRMGPFRLMDLIGNDVNYAVSCSVFDQLGAPERLKPSYIQEEKVKNGLLGIKTGEGYYKY